MIKVSEIKKGMVFMRTRDGEYQYFAESDAYLRNGIWCVDIGDGYRYGFTSNPDDLIDAQTPLNP